MGVEGGDTPLPVQMEKLRPPLGPSGQWEETVITEPGREGHKVDDAETLRVHACDAGPHCPFSILHLGAKILLQSCSHSGPNSWVQENLPAHL